jgi:hypothetical protein
VVNFTFVPPVLTDAQIATFLEDPKGVVDAGDLIRTLNRATAENSHRQARRDIVGESGTSYRLILRQSALDPSNFSVILAVVLDGRTTNLRRHNGTSHSHYNPIEDTGFANVCHIHIATERYQKIARSPEHYAEVTDEFHDLATALAFMLTETNFEQPLQGSLDLPL